MNIFQSPPTYGPNWIEIGSVTYTPASKWEKLTMTFTPTMNINTIIIGSPQKLPLSYPYEPSRGPYNAPYFLFDDLILNKAALFGVNIKRTGTFCENNLTLIANTTVNVSPAVQYQWYKNGIAIIGAINPTYYIPFNTANFGNYIVKVIDNSSCIQSFPYNVNNTIPEPTVSVQQPTCNTKTGIITVTSPALQYSFDNGVTWGTSNVSPPLVPRTYFVKTRNIENCESLKRVVINDLVVFPHMYIVSPVVYYLNSIAIPLTAGGTNLLWYTTETGGIGSSIAPTPSTLVLGSTNYYVSQTLNGCEGERSKITVEIIPIPYKFNYPHFFTPNEDGINDTWNISDFVEQNEPVIFIYDRYGKLLKRITRNDTGWDGTYNGHALPAGDYWFKVIYKEYKTMKEFKSHFTLKR